MTTGTGNTPDSGGTFGTGTTGGYGTGGGFGTSDTGAHETTGTGYESTGYESTGTTGYETSDSGTSDSGAKDKAKEAASTAADQGKQVAGTAKEEAANVAGTAKEQARNVVGDTVSQVRNQVGGQATTGRDKAATTLRTLGDDLEKMVQGEGSGEGMAADIAREVSTRVKSFSNQLESKEPTELLEDVRRFARRKPGMFLLGALAAGVAVGRAFRATADGAAMASLGQPSTTDTYGSDYGAGTYGAAGTTTGTAAAGGYSTGAASPASTSGFGTESTTGGGFSSAADDPDPLFGDHGTHASTNRPGTTGGDGLDPSPTLTTPASTDSSTTGLSGQRTQDTL